jgi:fructosamine-3-kinase
MTHPSSGATVEVVTAPTWLTRLRDVVGPLGPPRRLGAHVWKVEAGTGHHLVVKSGPGARDEAAGLSLLRAVDGAPPVPDVVLADEALLVTLAVEVGPRTAGHDEALGRSLGALHAAPYPHWGGGSSWIGACPVDPATSPEGARFYGARLHQLATRCGLAQAVDPVVARLEDLLPGGGPALLHGDLWWGNVLPGADGRSWLIDPSVHGGHPEEDLAMLALFGAVPDRLVGA